MSFGYGDSFDLGAIRRETVKTNDTLKELNIKINARNNARVLFAFLLRIDNFFMMDSPCWYSELYSLIFVSVNLKNNLT